MVKACVNATLLIQILSLIDSDIECNADNKLFKVVTKNGNYEMPNEDVSEFPTLPELINEKVFSVDSRDFCKGLEYAMASVGSDELRPLTMGINFEFALGKLIMCATDSFKISKYEFNIDSTDEVRMLLPKSASKYLTNAKDIVTIYVSERCAKFSFGNTILFSILMDFKFIDYHSLIPTYENAVSVSPKELEDAIKRVAVFTTHQNKLSLNVNNDSLIIYSENKEYGESGSETIRCESSIQIDINFKSNQLLDLIRVLPKDDIRIGTISTS